MGAHDQRKRNGARKKRQRDPEIDTAEGGNGCRDQQQDQECRKVAPRGLTPR
jgi:hypothetical protein